MTAVETEINPGSPAVPQALPQPIPVPLPPCKAILICPDQRPEVLGLSEPVPLSNVPVFGKSLIELWLEHLVTLGAREVFVLATDRPEQVRALTGNGSRWGLHVEVIPEIRELTPAEARVKYRALERNGWLAAPYDASLMEHLPGLPEFPLFSGYAGFFAALQTWLPRAASPDRLGVHQLQPGVWAGLHTHISSGAELRAPCWIGDNVFIGAEAIIGPQAVLERAAFVESGAEVSESVIGPETLVGQSTEIRHSIAWGNTLVNWKLNSCIKVPDAFLLCSLSRRPSAFKPVGLFSRLAAAMVILLTLPIALLAALISWIRGGLVLRPLLAVRPCTDRFALLPGHTLIYYELATVGGWFRRWPQLWSIVCGDFAWVGNRPLNPSEATSLSNDFERLWLTAAPGLISLADVEGCPNIFSDEARAHASFYAVRMSRRLDTVILFRALFLFAFGFPYTTAREFLTQSLRHFKTREQWFHLSWKSNDKTEL